MLFRRLYSVPKRTFEKYVSNNIIMKLKQKNIEVPTAVQESLLPVIQSNSDLILKDETGTGKTLGIVLGILSKKRMELSFDSQLDQEQIEFLKRRWNKPFIHTLFVVPTRDLAAQIYHWFLDLRPGNGESEGFIQMVVPSGSPGGSIEEQKVKLERNTPQILVGTSNRLLELLNGVGYDCTRLQTLVIDEADRILIPLSRYANVKKQFNRKIHVPSGEELITRIFRLKNKRATFKDEAQKRRLQLIVSSATANNPLKKLLFSKRWIERDCVVLNVGQNIPKNIKHLAYYLSENDLLVEIGNYEAPNDSHLTDTVEAVSMDLLAESISALCNMHKIKKSLIFVQSEIPISLLVDNLNTLGMRSQSLSNLNNYNETEKPFVSLENGKTDFVVGTEYEARGLDIPSLDNVIIVGAYSAQSYIHLCGRTGRFGKPGTAITLLTDLQQVKKYLKITKQIAVEVGKSD